MNKRYHIIHYQQNVMVRAITNEYSLYAREDIVLLASDTTRDDGIDADGDDIYVDDLEPCTLIHNWESYLERSTLACMTIAESPDCRVTLEITQYKGN